MKSQWLEQSLKYDGRQLEPLTNYLQHGLLGDSVVAWQGPCDVSLEHMIDGEDLRQEAKIQSDSMLHFVVELFDFPLVGMILLQRLMAQQVVLKISKKQKDLVRRGDDIYWNDKKLNVSIATQSIRSSLLHFGINIENKGTPVSTCSLSDFDVEALAFAEEMMEFLQGEVASIRKASYKVKLF